MNPHTTHHAQPHARVHAHVHAHDAAGIDGTGGSGSSGGRPIWRESPVRASAQDAMEGIGENSGSEGKVSGDGLPTSSSVENVESLINILRSGKTSFNDSEDLGAFLRMVENCLVFAHADCRSMQAQFLNIQRQKEYLVQDVRDLHESNVGMAAQARRKDSFFALQNAGT